MTHRLSAATLPSLAGRAALPRYDRTALQTGIVHLGLGAFHRAHQACYTEAALDAGDLRWGSIGVSLRSPETRDALAPQDGLYTVAVRGDENRLQVNGGMRGMLVAPEDPAALIAALARPDVRIVSLTITEKGYCRDAASGDLNETNPDIEHDRQHPEAPRSALGFLVAAITARRAAGLSPFTLLSCDNLPANGHTLKRLLTQFAAGRDANLARFIAAGIHSPSTMVDRIVPATSEDDRAFVAMRLGVTDAWPLMTEPFTQWVIEDDFPAGRPDWSLMGAEFVPDARPYETMKLRLLNGAHSAIAYLGYLGGFETIAEAMAEPTLAAFVERMMREEIAPTLKMPPGADLDAYIRALLVRFRNRALKHRTWQVAMDGSQKLPQRWFGPIRERLAIGAPIDCLVLGLGAWMAYVGGRDEKGEPIDVRDPLSGEFSRVAGTHRVGTPEYVSSLLAIPMVFGADFATNPRFVAAVTEAHRLVVTEGALAAMRLTLQRR